MSPLAQSRQASSKLTALTPCTRREDECTTAAPSRAVAAVVLTALGIVLVLVMFATAYVVMP